MSISVPSRTVGNDTVSAIALGCMGGYSIEQGSDEERMKLLDRAYELGCRNWDCADIYRDWEEVIGRWFARNPEKRKDIFLATKFGFQSDFVTIRAEPAYAKECAEKSLARLGVDQIDLYYLHRVSTSVPVEETIAAMAELVKDGKVKYLGISECSASSLRRAHAVHPISAIQMEYSPFALDIEDPSLGLLDTARELGVTVFAYAPLGRGMLTGQFKSLEDLPKDDFRRGYDRYSKENFPKVLDVVHTVEKIAEKHNATSSQVSIAFVLAQGDDFIPIPGTKKIKYLDQNFAASKLKLSAEDVSEIREATKRSGLADIARYPAAMAANIYADSPPLKT